MVRNSYCLKFGEILRATLGLREMGVREFAAKVEIDPGYLSGILAGRRPPPLKKIEFWAEALKLAGESRRTFLETGYLSHCPQNTCDLVDALRSEVRRLKQRVVDLK